MMLDDARVVYVDASWQDGVAGLAVVGVLGVHTLRLEGCRSSTWAEREAMKLAMRIAGQRGLKDLVFRTDCGYVARMWAEGKPSKRWVVEQVSRDRNRRADRWAKRARLGLVSGADVANVAAAA